MGVQRVVTVVKDGPLPRVGVPVDPASSDDPEALFREARRRRRIIRAWWAGGVALVLLVAGVAIAIAHSGPGRSVHAPPAASKAQPPLAAATIATCTASQLSGEGGLGAGAGSSVGVFGLTNTGASNCELRGYLSIAILDKDGTTLHLKTLHDPSPPITLPTLPKGAHVVLPAGKANAAQFFVDWANWCGANPSPITVTLTLPHGGTLVVRPYPPDNGEPTWLIPRCDYSGSPSDVVISPVVPETPQ